MPCSSGASSEQKTERLASPTRGTRAMVEGPRSAPRSTIATMQAVFLAEPLLDGMQVPFLLKSLNSLDLAAIGSHGERSAGLGGLAINEDRACTTRGRIAANMGTGEMQTITYPVDKQHASI